MTKEDKMGEASQFIDFVRAGVDLNHLIQAQLREAYLESTEDLRFYAAKVKHFNQCKRLIRNYVGELRRLRSEIVSQAFEQKIDLSPEGKVELAQLASLVAELATDYELDEMAYGLGIPARVPPEGVTTPRELDALIKHWEEELQAVGDDAQLANVDMQNMLQKQQQTMQMMSQISKALHDTAMAVIRKMGS
jgi:hypothetical protein